MPHTFIEFWARGPTAMVVAAPMAVRGQWRRTPVEEMRTPLLETPAPMAKVRQLANLAPSTRSTLGHGICQCWRCCARFGNRQARGLQGSFRRVDGYRGRTCRRSDGGSDIYDQYHDGCSRQDLCRLSAEIAADQQTSKDALNAAANKTPVSQDTHDALDGLLVGNNPVGAVGVGGRAIKVA